MIYEPCTTLFVGKTNCGKTYKVLVLLEGVYRGHFEYIFIICPTLKWNKTYHGRKWFWEDENVFVVHKFSDLNKVLSLFSNIFAGSMTLFVIDDCIAFEGMDKRRSPLIDLAVSGRYRMHSMWILTQSITAIPKNVRRQISQYFVWRLKEKQDWDTLIKESDVELDVDTSKDKLHHEERCLYIKEGFPSVACII